MKQRPVEWCRAAGNVGQGMLLWRLNGVPPRIGEFSLRGATDNPMKAHAVPERRLQVALASGKVVIAADCAAGACATWVMRS